MPIFLFVFIMLATLSSCSDQKKPLNIAGNNWLGYQPFYIYDEVHFRNHADRRSNDGAQYHNSAFFKVTQLPSTTIVLQKMKDGLLDGALLTLDEATILQSKTDMQLCIPLVLDYSYGGDALIIRPESQKLLNKKTTVIAYESTALGGYMYERALEKLQLDEKKVSHKILQPHEHYNAFKKGEVDAVITFEPYATKIVEAGGEVIFSSKDIPLEIVDVLVLKKSTWLERKNKVNELVNVVWPYALETLIEGGNTVNYLLKVNAGLNKEATQQALKGLAFLSAQENKVLLQSDLEVLVKRMNQFLQEKGFIDKKALLPACL